MNHQFAKNNFDKLAKLEREIEKLSEQKELHWNQRSRVNLLKMEIVIQNIHSPASARRHTNFIKGLYDSNGVWFSDNQGMVNITLDYFANIFSSSNPYLMIPMQFLKKWSQWLEHKRMIF